MGDIGEPGSPSRQIVRAALLAGRGVAACNCNAREGALDLEHADTCPVKISLLRAGEISRQEASQRGR